jgi:hypothetical protein
MDARTDVDPHLGADPIADRMLFNMLAWAQAAIA